MNDPRVGLTRRYNGVDEILEANGGKKRIQGTNYNALRTLKDPLYVKYGEQLRQESRDSTNARLDYEEFANMLRRFTSENDINHGVAENIVRNAPAAPAAAPAAPVPMDVDEKTDDDKKKKKDAEDDARTEVGDPRDDNDDDFNDGFPGPMGGDNRPPIKRRNTPKRTPKPPPGYSQFARGSDDRPEDGDEPPKRVAVSSQVFRRNLELEAQIAELREEIKRAARKQEAAEAVRASIPRDNPTKEIIRELHQVPVAAPQDPQVLSLLQQAMSSNQNMATYAQQMGMTIVQFMAWARGQMGAASQAAPPASYRIDTPQPPLKPFNPSVAQVPASSGGGAPPPAPKKIRAASPEMAKVAKAKAAIPPEAPPVAKPSAVQPKPTAAPIRPTEAPPPAPPPKPAAAPIRPTEAPRPKPSAAPPKPSAVAVSRSRSRAASTATVDYGDTKVPASREASVVPRPRSASAAKVPAEANVVPRNASQASRAASVATVDYGDGKAERSRSRTAAQEIVPNPRIILPIREERGRSPPKVQKVMEAIHKSQSRELVKGQMRHELGRFAKAFAKKRAEPPPRAPSAPAQPKTMTFDEIVAVTEAREGAVKEKTVPFGAARQKQRTTSLGDARVRFRGRPIVA